MYESFFRLREPAFSLAPDPRFLWLSETHEEGLAALVYGITRRKGFMLLTGEVGTGKTTLLRAALDQLPPDTEVALVMNTAELSPTELLRLIASEFQLPGPFTSKVDYIIALNRFLLEQLERGTNTVLIIDEAQNLDPVLLEEVRLLSNLETPTSKLIQIMLVGQPELADLLARPELRQLRQRIVLRHNLRPFGEAETATYVNERLRLAGYTGKGLFDKRAFTELFRLTQGVPRLVNVVCDGALLLGYARELRTIGANEIREVGRDLALEPAAATADKAPAAASAKPPASARASGWFGWLRRRQTRGA